MRNVYGHKMTRSAAVVILNSFIFHGSCRRNQTKQTRFQGLTSVLLQVKARSGPEFIKLFSCSTQLNTKFILLINVKMPTTVGILTFIGRINTTFERLKARNFFICQYFSFYGQLKFLAQLS